MSAGGERPLAPSATLGGLRLLRKLGRGGMGEVWLARDEALGVDRAVKVLLPERAVDPALRVRFTAEARTLAVLGDVPGLVRVHAAGEDSLTGLPYFVMDAHLLAPDDIRRLCVGRLGLTPVAADRIAACPIGISGESSRPVPNPFTLDNALGGGAEENARALPERAVLTIAREIAAALDSLHRRKPPVVHRDLKPSNLLFSGNGSLLLADFGIAKVLDPDHPGPTLTGIQPGSHRYAAPEQREGRPATPAADWYALGVVLYRALTGSFPEWGEDFPTDPARPHFSPLWKPLLSQLLAPDPARRLDDSTQFLDALDAIERSLSPRPRHRHARAVLIWFLAFLGCLGALGTVWFRSKGGSNDSGITDSSIASTTEHADDAKVVSHAEGSENADFSRSMTIQDVYAGPKWPTQEPSGPFRKSIEKWRREDEEARVSAAMAGRHPTTRRPLERYETDMYRSAMTLVLRRRAGQPVSDADLEAVHLLREEWEAWAETIDRLRAEQDSANHKISADSEETKGKVPVP